MIKLNHITLYMINTSVIAPRRKDVSDWVGLTLKLSREAVSNTNVQENILLDMLSWLSALIKYSKKQVSMDCTAPTLTGMFPELHLLLSYRWQLLIDYGY